PEEVCDGLDNDCDGQTDEDFDVGAACTVGRGECASSGASVCNARGDGLLCNADAGQAQEEQCDGRDNDCDGAVDEDARDANACGVCAPLPAEICNMVDDDCDGETDEGFNQGQVCEVALSEVYQRPHRMVCMPDGSATCGPLSELREVQQAFWGGVLAVGTDYTCVRTGQSVQCLGNPPTLGDEWPALQGSRPEHMGANLPSLDLGVLVTRISGNASGMCARDRQGRIKCLGSNSWGQLGLGRWEPHLNDWDLADRPPIDLRMAADTVSVGHNDTCVLGSDGIKCWGRNDEGQLGLGHDDVLGDQPQDMGANLPFIPLGFEPSALSVGAYSQCAIGSAAGEVSVKCWGKNYHGQLGVDVAVEQLGANPAEMGDALPTLDLGMTPVALASGLAFHCALGELGRVKCWGLGLYAGAPNGLAGLDAPLELGMRAIAISAGARTVCAVGSDGELVCWGREFPSGEARGPRRIFLGMLVAGVAVGGSHICAKAVNGDVKCWGANSEGQLGQGDRRDRVASWQIEPIDLN
ncbi:MAG: hypothetical protein ACI9U2_003913, partial [Bradymonadia bacterium]